MKKEQYLSHLSRVELRKLFIERLIDACRYAVIKSDDLYNPQNNDYGDQKFLDKLVYDTKNAVKVYEEIVLAATSEELETVDDILKELDYDAESYYVRFKGLPYPSFRK